MEYTIDPASQMKKAQAAGLCFFLAAGARDVYINDFVSFLITLLGTATPNDMYIIWLLVGR